MRKGGNLARPGERTRRGKRRHLPPGILARARPVGKLKAPVPARIAIARRAAICFHVASPREGCHGPVPCKQPARTAPAAREGHETLDRREGGYEQSPHATAGARDAAE